MGWCTAGQFNAAVERMLVCKGGGEPRGCLSEVGTGEGVYTSGSLVCKQGERRRSPEWKELELGDWFRPGPYFRTGARIKFEARN